MVKNYKVFDKAYNPCLKAYGINELEKEQLYCFKNGNIILKYRYQTINLYLFEVIAGEDIYYHDSIGLVPFCHDISLEFFKCKKIK